MYSMACACSASCGRSAYDKGEHLKCLPRIFFCALRGLVPEVQRAVSYFVCAFRLSTVYVKAYNESDIYDVSVLRSRPSLKECFLPQALQSTLFLAIFASR